jgi:hypothetical protein
MANITAGENLWKLSFQVSPILLSGGLFQFMPQGTMPLIAITELINFPAGLLSGLDVSLDNVFANFKPLTGSTALSVEIAHYPLPNRQLAGNSVVFQPLQISMEMVCPAKTDMGYSEKLAVFSALQYALNLHIQLGGTFIVMTPSMIYNNCLLRSVRDVTGGVRTQQPQIMWQFDFERPLVTESEAEGTLSSLTSWITRQVAPAGAPDVSMLTGVASTVGTGNSLGGNAGVPVAGQASPGSTIGTPPQPGGMSYGYPR